MKALHDVPAPAKINLFLHVTGRRADGYHLIQSAFMLLDWCDTLHFETRADGKITREDLGPALPPNDLTTRAAKALQAATGCPLGVHIGVDKQVPAQAGMGGGSSDAASCLLALNRLWKLHLTQRERLGGGRWRTHNTADSAACPFCGDQATRRAGNSSHFCGARPATQHKYCYTCGLRSRPVRLRPQRSARCRAEALSPDRPGP